MLKNKPELVAKAKEVRCPAAPAHERFLRSEREPSAAATADKMRRGTPFGVTIDFETLGERGEELKDTVTLRHRDSMKQERMPIAELPAYLLTRIM